MWIYISRLSTSRSTNKVMHVRMMENENCEYYAVAFSTSPITCMLVINGSYASFVRTVVFNGFALLFFNGKETKRRHDIFIFRKEDI